MAQKRLKKSFWQVLYRSEILVIIYCLYYFFTSQLIKKKLVKGNLHYYSDISMYFDIANHLDIM